MERGISELGKVRVQGPLAQFAPLVAAEAREYGYTPLTIASVLRLTANLSQWMETRGMGPRDLITILQTIKAAGALQAEIEVI